MGKKRTKIDAPRAWGGDTGGSLCHWALSDYQREKHAAEIAVDLVRVRILREADYRRLLAAAKRGRKPERKA